MKRSGTQRGTPQGQEGRMMRGEREILCTPTHRRIALDARIAQCSSKSNRLNHHVLMTTLTRCCCPSSSLPLFPFAKSLHRGSVMPNSSSPTTKRMNMEGTERVVERGVNSPLHISDPRNHICQGQCYHGLVQLQEAVNS